MKIKGVLLLALTCSLTLWAGGYDPESLADKRCDTPEDVTGYVDIGPAIDGSGDASSIVWDGEAYAMVWRNSDTTSLNWARVAADGTVLAGPVTLALWGSGLDQDHPQIVWNGSDYGLVWQQRIAGGPVYLVQFARISKTGAVVPGSEHHPGAPSSTQFTPDLVWTGSEYGVVWSDNDLSPDGDIFFARLDASGNQVGDRVEICTASGSQYKPSIVWTGTLYGIAWCDNRNPVNDYDIYFRPVMASGMPGMEFQVTSTARGDYYPSLAWTGSEYAVAWSASDHKYYFNRFLNPLVGTELAVSSRGFGSSDCSLVWTGAEFGVLMQCDSGSVYFQRISAAGALVGPEVPIAPDSDLVGTIIYDSLAFGTMGYGISLGRGTRSVFVGLGCHGDTTPPPCPMGLGSPSQGQDSITLSWASLIDPESDIAYYSVYRDGSYLAHTTSTGYTDTGLSPDTSYSYTVIARNAAGLESVGCASAAFSTSGSGECAWSVLSGITDLQSATQVSGASTVWNGTDYGVVWSSYATGDPEFYFARVATSGAVLLGPIQLTNDDQIKYSPSLAWNGSGYCLVWEDLRNTYADIYSLALDTTGAPVGSANRVTTDGANQREPSITSNGTGYGVAWSDERNGGTNPDIYFVALTSAGAPTGGERQVTDLDSYQQNPSLVWNGNGYGVAYRDQRSGMQIYFSTLDASGNNISGELPVTTGGSDHRAPSLAWTGSRYGLAWHDYESGNGDVRFAVLDVFGAKIGSDARVTTNSSDQTNPSLTYKGDGFGLAWEDTRNGNHDIYFAALGSSGAKTQPEILVSTLSTYNVLLRGALAAGGGGFGLAWTQSGPPGIAHSATIGCPGDDTPPSCPGTPHETDRDWFPPTDAVTLSWGASSDLETGISHYEVYRHWVLLARTTSTSYRDATFTHYGGYVYDIVAVNGAGIPSAGCASVDTTDSVPPTCPENIMATAVQADRVDLAWLPSSDDLSGFSLYLVYRNNQWIDYAYGTTYSDLAVSGGTTYNYAIVPNDYAGNQRFDCQTLWVSTSPIMLKMTKNPDGVNADLDWTDVHINQYVVYRSTDPQAFSELKRVPANETIDTVLQDGVRIWYYYIQQKE